MANIIRPLEYIEKTGSEHVEYIVTKRDKPVAKLVPLKQDIFEFGRLKGTATLKGNITDSIDVEWEA